MSIYIRWLIILGIILSFSSPAHAFWKNKIVKNQIKAVEYIQELRNGADPDEITRPTLRRDRKARAQAPNRELKVAIAKAERLARAGRHDRIEIPEFKHKIVSERRYKELERELKQKK